MDPLARLVFALLVLACFAAFLITQRLKHTPTAVQSFKLAPFFSPSPAGHIKVEPISFKLAKADEVTVTIVDSKDDVIATLVHDRSVPRYKQFSLRWNGRGGPARGQRVSAGADGTVIVYPDNVGSPAPPGEYRVEIVLKNAGRRVFSPRSFTLVRP